MSVQSPVLPSFIVFLAAYNGMRWLSEQLASILNQEGVRVTVLVSVDRSSDGTEAWIDDIARADSRVLVLPHGEVFGGACRNFFRLMRDADLAHADYVSLADQDDIWLPDKLQRAHSVLVADAAQAYSSNVLAFWPDGRTAPITKSHAQVNWDFLFEAAGPGCTYVLARPLALALQQHLAKHWEACQQVGLHDWFFYAYARSHGYRWIIDDRFGMRYRQHGGNQVGANQGWKAFRYRVRQVIGGWAMEQAALIAQLVGVERDPFVSGWMNGSRAGMIQLALKARQCRRRGRDQLLFGLSCLALAATGKRIK